jgi:hypothetical protein
VDNKLSEIEMMRLILTIAIPSMLFVGCSKNKNVTAPIPPQPLQVYREFIGGQPATLISANGHMHHITGITIGGEPGNEVHLMIDGSDIMRLSLIQDNILWSSNGGAPIVVNANDTLTADARYARRVWILITGYEL